MASFGPSLVGMSQRQVLSSVPGGCWLEALLGWALVSWSWLMVADRGCVKVGLSVEIGLVYGGLAAVGLGIT